MATTMTQPQMHTTGQTLPVNVTVELHDDNPLKYDIVSGSKELPVETIKYKSKEEFKLNFNNNQNGSSYNGFEITFTFVDQTGKGYGFFFSDPKKPNADEAFWVKSVDSTGSCPTMQSSLPHIQARSVTRNTLVVVNPNGHLEYFGFALALSRASETAPSILIDPIGDNQDSQIRINLGGIPG